MTNQPDLSEYLKPGIYVDSDSPEVLEFVQNHAKGDTLKEKAISLFLAVRDDFWYDPYDIVFKPDEFKASVLIKKRKGFCVTKAIILAAVLRAAGIPSRLAYADVKNHLNTQRLREMMNTEIFYYHGFTELFLDGQWLKVTPTFNKDLCDKFGVIPLDFDGTSDCIFHSYDIKGNKHMEYVNFHETYDDCPYELLVREYHRAYPNMFTTEGTTSDGNFAQEADEERSKDGDRE